MTDDERGKLRMNLYFALGLGAGAIAKQASECRAEGSPAVAVSFEKAATLLHTHAEAMVEGVIAAREAGGG